MPALPVPTARTPASSKTRALAASHAFAMIRISGPRCICWKARALATRSISRRPVGEGLGVVVALHLRAAIEDLRVAFRDLLVERDELRVHVAHGARLELEVMVLVHAAHEGRAVVAGDLRHGRGDVADRAAASAGGRGGGG